MIKDKDNFTCSKMYSSICSTNLAGQKNCDCCDCFYNKCSNCSYEKKLRATEGKGLTIDQITGDATIKNGNFILTIPKYEQLTGLKTSAYQLLDAITVALTESGAKSPTVILPLEEYMKRRGLKDRKEAKTQAKADMEILRGASFSWEEKRGKKVESYAFVNLADSGEIRRNGDIVFTYGNTFYNILLGYPVMPYPAQLQPDSKSIARQ